MLREFAAAYLRCRYARVEDGIKQILTLRLRVIESRSGYREPGCSRTGILRAGVA
jgi:hypothetical protein